jgi:Domain of unknown function (DUF4203)
MTSESFFSVLITTLIALFFGFVLTVNGYRFFLVLLPIFGFFYGFGLGAQSMQALFGEAFLATLSSWAVGFIFAVLFAVMSYLFYFAGVGFVAFALGYSVGVGVMEALGLDFGFVAWLVGVVLGIGVVFATFLLNIQKYVIIGATSILGAGVIIATFLFAFGGAPVRVLTQNPVQYVLNTSPFWVLVFLVLATLGVVVQVVSTRRWELDTGNRLLEMAGEPPPSGESTPPPLAGESTPPPPAGQSTPPPAGQPLTS